MYSFPSKPFTELVLKKFDWTDRQIWISHSTDINQDETIAGFTEENRDKLQRQLWFLGRKQIHLVMKTVRKYQRSETLLRAFIQQLIAEVSGTHYRESGKWATHNIVKYRIGFCSVFQTCQICCIAISIKTHWNCRVRKQHIF